MRWKETQYDLVKRLATSVYIYKHKYIHTYTYEFVKYEHSFLTKQGWQARPVASGGGHSMCPRLAQTDKPYADLIQNMANV